MKLTVKELIFPLEGRATPACHASTLVMLPGGELLAAWFGGEREKADDVEIYTAQRTAAGWSRPVCVSEPCDLPRWNPVLYAEGERVTLWYKHGRPIPEWITLVRRSEDGGRTWTPERELVPGDRSGGRGPVKNKPVLLSDGALLAGASHERPDGTWLAFAERSEDGGLTWTRGDYLRADPPAHLIQPTLWESESGVHMLLRSAEGRVYRADSRDLGRTWSAATPTDMPNNNSGLDCCALPDGRVALVCNPVGVKGVRTPVTLFVSGDDGASWEKVADLETGEGEYSYPCVIYAGGALHIAFTWRRQSIMYCRVEV